MNIVEITKLTSMSAALFMLLDMLWLGLIMPKFYSAQLGYLLRLPVNYTPSHIAAAIAVWSLIALGAVVLVLPRVSSSGWLDVFKMGMVYGLIIYGVYNLTNYAVIAGYPYQMVLVDTVWGSVACGILSCIVKGLCGVLL